MTTLRRGREKLHYLNAAPINDIADRWIHHYDRARAEALADLKTALEATPMDQKSNETTFVYTTYIHATPERVWQGLTDPTFTERYWRHPKSGGVSYRTDWQKGSTYDVAYDEVGLVISDAEQVVLESDPYRRLAYTWHTFSPEWAAAHGIDEATVAAWRAEPRSKVAFDIEEAGEGVVKLTVVHDGFEPGSAVLEGCAAGGRRSCQPQDLARDRRAPCRRRRPWATSRRRSGRGSGRPASAEAGGAIAVKTEVSPLASWRGALGVGYSVCYFEMTQS